MPLSQFQVNKAYSVTEWCPQRYSNSRPINYKSVALPAVHKLFSATLISAYHRFKHKLTTFGLPFGLPHPRMGHRGCTRSLFLECAADGMNSFNVEDF